MKAFVFISLLVLALPGCTDLKDGGGVGPCVHVYEEPILNVVSVTNSASGQQILAFQIVNATLDGRKLDPFQLKIESYNVAAYDSLLVCNVPCGFGVGDGTYALRVRAPGYRDTTLNVTASYAINKGGCPSSSSGGTRFTFQLQSQ